MAAHVWDARRDREMTGQERRIAELAASDLESWALELPLGSEVRRDLQQTARAYRFSARAGAVALQAVPETQEDRAPRVLHAVSNPGVEPAPGRAGLAEAPLEVHPPPDLGA